MKHIIIIFLLFLSHCQSVSNYLQYRAYDFRDMFTIGVEKNVAGGSFYIWCFGAGLQYGSEGNGYGIRSGSYGEYATGYSGEIPPDRSYVTSKVTKYSPGQYIPPTGPTSTSFTVHYGSSNFVMDNSIESVPYKTSDLRVKDKSYSAVTLFILPYPPLRYDLEERDPEFYRLSKLGRKCDMALQTEVSFGLYYGLRLGFNAYEALDFIAGIFGIDVLKDDTLEPMTEKDRREMLSEIHFRTRGTRFAWMGEACAKDRICKEGLCVDGTCQDKRMEETDNWTGRFCYAQHPCRQGVCLDGVCMAHKMMEKHPEKKRINMCGMEGDECSFFSRCKVGCGACVEGRCKWWE